MIRKFFAIAILSVTACAPAAGTALADPPKVVVSIKPIHSLAAGVMGGIGAPTLLIGGGASPHSYTLRPSEAESLQDADVVFWIGEEMETFLERPLRAVPRNARVVALHEAEGVRLLGVHGGSNHGHGHGERNMHIWLDPANARAMVSAIAETLIQSDPDNAERYRANADALSTKLTELDLELRDALTAFGDRPYVVFHDAYAYFERRYGLTPVGFLTVDPDRKPSAKRVSEIRQTIAETAAVCVFSEPQFEPAIVDTVIEGTAAKAAVLDPLGAALTPGADAYFQLMRGLAVSMTNCLGRSG